MKRRLTVNNPMLYSTITILCGWLLIQESLWAQSSLRPEDQVKTFIADYERWNDELVELSRKMDTLQLMEVAESNYKALLKKYCKPDIEHEAIAFREDADHRKDSEVITRIDASQKATVISTRHKYKNGGTTEYEYHFTWDAKTARWYLQRIYNLHSEGKINTL